MTRIGERQLGREVAVACYQRGEGVATVVARQHDVYHRLCQRHNVADDAWASLVEYEHYGLARCGESLHQAALCVGQPEVGYVARSLGIRCLAYARHDYVGIACGVHGSLYVCRSHLVYLSAFLVAHALHELHVVASEAVAHGFVYGVVLHGALVGLVALP